VARVLKIRIDIGSNEVEEGRRSKKKPTFDSDTNALLYHRERPQDMGADS